MSTRYQAVQKSPFFLCSYFVFKRLYPQGTGAGLLGLTVFCSAALNIVRHRQQHGLNKDIPCATAQEPTEIHIRLHHCKCTLCLYASVHAQLHSFLGGYPLQILLALAKELLGYFEFLGSFLQRGLAMVSMYALALHRAVAAV